MPFVCAPKKDWETGIYNALQPLLSCTASSSKWSRQEALLAFSSVEKNLQVQHPEMLYSELLSKAHEVFEARLKAAAGKESHSSTTLEGDTSLDAAMTSTSASTSNQDPLASDAFGESIKNWPLFPDTLQALRTLAQHYKMVVLSNVDRTSFAHTHAQLSGDSSSSVGSEIYTYPQQNTRADQYWFPQTIPGSQSPFTLILTAQDTHAYKPSLVGFTRALECIQSDPALLRTPKNQVLIVAQSLYHDHGPARQLRMESVWIDRSGACMGINMDGGGAVHVAESETEGRVGGHDWTWRFETLGEMAEAVEREKALSA